MSEQEKAFSEIFGSLSEKAQILLISMTLPSIEIGMTIDAAKATSDLDGEEFDDATRELLDRNLLQRGKFGENNKSFFFDKDGDRLRLFPEIQEKVMTDILKFQKK